MKARSSVLLGALMLLAACAPRTAPRWSTTPAASTATPSDRRVDLPSVPMGSIRARVLSVTDGDTIVLNGIDIGEVHRATGGRKSRLIGVDTPEVFGDDECFGAKASSFTKAELDGTEVRVAFDIGRTDRYGRALVYVWDDRGRFFNGRLAQEGYALQLTVPPNVRYASLFTELAREARRAGRGLWSEC